MSDTPSDTASDTSDAPPPPRPPVRHSQRQILELAYTSLSELPGVDPDRTQFVQSVATLPAGELIKLVFTGGETWWVTAVRGGGR